MPSNYTTQNTLSYLYLHKINPQLPSLNKTSKKSDDAENPAHN